MYIYIMILILILFLIFNIVWKNELIKSLFFTICFIIALWINTPCFIGISASEQDDSLIMLPFKLNDQFGILYIIFANVLLGIILFLQSRWTNKVEYSYKEIKKIYDNFAEDAVELFVIGKDLDFLYKEKFERQTERVEHLKSHCKLLCESTMDKRLLGLYKKVSEKGVEIWFYAQNDNVIYLKGQIKTDQSGIKKAIFTPRLKKNYFLISTDNQFLVSTILERCIKVYQKQEI